MTVDEAKAECERWFAYLQRQKDRSVEIQKIASDVRTGAIAPEEGQKRVRRIDGCSVTVYDGANLEKSVRVLLKRLASIEKGKMTTEAEARACRTETAVKAASQQARSQAIDDCIAAILALPDYNDFTKEAFAEALRRFKEREALKGST